jgi:hypothetical protein
VKNFDMFSNRCTPKLALPLVMSLAVLVAPTIIQ